MSLGPFATSVSAQSPSIVAVDIEQEGIPISEPVVAALLETRVGEPLSMRDVRETVTHLMSLNRYEDVQVFQETMANGIRLRYVLVPLHPIDRVEYRGNLAVSDSELRQSISERFGTALVPGRIEDLQRQLEQFYRDRGYIAATVTPRVEQTHRPDRASLVFDINAGRRSAIAMVDVENVPQEDRATLIADADLRVGQPYDAVTIQAALDRHQASLRSRGFYEARAVHFASFDSAGGARVVVTLDRGPRVAIEFRGDTIPESERTRLVPIASEASVDEDLLEDSSRAIEDYLRSRGYRDALVAHERVPSGDDAVTITFTVSRGPRYLTDAVRISGNTAVSGTEALAALQVKEGAPYVQSGVDTGVIALRNVYRARGFSRPEIRATPAVVEGSGEGGGDRRVELQIAVVEGPRTRIGQLAFTGNTVMSEIQLRSLIATGEGRAFNEGEVAVDRDRIDLEYRNRGYDSVVVDPRVTLAEGDTRADVQFVVTEGPQVFVDQVIILGNQRTSLTTISRELTLRSGEPLGYAAMLESQQRLSALGLFRRISITSLPHAGEPRRDVLVQVEEAPPTTLGYGGGIEGGQRLRPTGPEGQAEERFEFAPRGFFEVTRRNLWGKNRAVTLFGRVSLRARDIVFSDAGLRLEEPAPGTGYGFNEYRVYGTYREPRLLNTRFDAVLTGILDQAIRSSFNFRTREARAEVGARISPAYTAVGRFSFRHTTLFDERFSEEDKPLIDRLFPQIRVAKLSTSLIRDTRDDVLYPNRGTFMIADGDLAAKALGSEVGFVKTFVQAFAYVPLKTQRRTILAMAARIGAAHGFELGQVVPAGNPTPQEVVLLPASERFFAGGDTTVRGFALDRLGDDETISKDGFPTGGNGEIVFQTELRVNVFRNRAELVGFFDAGNIFLRASDLDLTNLRPTAGFGGRYRSPIGPVRVDVGFNLDRHELVPGTLERAWVLHISLGQAF